ncbi:uncharacterized protein NPIL_215041 [Nephila pilipes]|uniref:Uncharacterized protein n=1 Tax=Nephila pilipes TaxID=299642 RepID=A0A8X6NN53_NEPPI|nr:uncharacterized protein NPIL_215041 [Nephila pilipes]
MDNIVRQCTLTSINGSEEEKKYITRMRNIIEFQIEELREKRQHRSFRQMVIHLYPPILSILDYACEQIVLAHVQVHKNKEHLFQNWELITVDQNGFRGLNRSPQTVTVRSPAPPTNRYLVTEFSNLVTRTFHRYPLLHPTFDIPFYTAPLLHTLRIDPQENGDESSNERDAMMNPTRELYWKRVYDESWLYFHEPHAIDINFYLKEQALRRSPVNVFTRIMRREDGDPFDPRAILRKIAAPYYYVLPHRDEQKHEQFISDLRDLDIEYGSLHFDVQLQFARKV